MAGITDFLNASPQMRLSGIDARLGELQREFDQAQINGDTARATMLNEQNQRNDQRKGQRDGNDRRHAASS